MGASLSAEGSPLTGSNDFSLGQMAKSVHFSKDELKRFQSAFMAIAADSPDAGSTVITLEQFGRALNNVEVPAASSNFLSLLFNAFDKNGDGKVNFVEFCAGLSIILKGGSRTHAAARMRRSHTAHHRPCQARPTRSTACVLTFTMCRRPATSTGEPKRLSACTGSRAPPAAALTATAGGLFRCPFRAAGRRCGRCSRP